MQLWRKYMCIPASISIYNIYFFQIQYFQLLKLILEWYKIQIDADFFPK